MHSRNLITLKRKALKKEDSFTYLGVGSVIDKQAGTKAYVKARLFKLEQHSNSFQKFGEQVTSPHQAVSFDFSIQTKTMKTVVNSVQTFISKCVGSVLKIKWQDEILNEDLWTRACQKPIEHENGLWRWCWIEHIWTLRKPSTCVKQITRQSPQWNPHGMRRWE